MLQKVQLLVRCSDEKVLAVAIFALAIDFAIVANDAVALVLAEMRMGDDDIVRLSTSAEQCVLRLDNRIAASLLLLLWRSFSFRQRVRRLIVRRGLSQFRCSHAVTCPELCALNRSD